jgi:leucyl-tRNA synthetase
VAEELWQELGHEPSILGAPWPKVNEVALHRDQVELVLQVNGKIRGHIEVPAEASREAIEALAMENPGVRKWTAGKTIRKVIVVPGRLVNVAAS